jgi:hypothetical protein
MNGKVYYRHVAAERYAESTPEYEVLACFSRA